MTHEPSDIPTKQPVTDCYAGPEQYSPHRQYKKGAGEVHKCEVELTRKNRQFLCVLVRL
jgi:hypothetical protein